MKWIPTLPLAVAAFCALAGCGTAPGSSAPVQAGNHTACKDAMVRELRTAIAQGSSATPAGRPPACIGVSDKLLQQYVAEAMKEIFDATVSPLPQSSASFASQFAVPDLTGMSLDQADSLATSSGEYTTPETADGNSPTIAHQTDWTVCSQTPAAGTTTGSNGIILTVVDTAAGEHC